MWILPSTDQLESFFPTFDEQDEYSKNLSLAKFIHLCEQKTLEVDFFQKRLINKVIEKAQLKFTNAALKEYYLKRAAYKAQIVEKRNRARPEEYIYAVANNPLALAHIDELHRMRDRFASMGCGTLVGEMRVAILFSYLGWGQCDAILKILQGIQGGIKDHFWTIAVESYFERNEIKPLPLIALFKIREFYPTIEGLNIFIRMLSCEEKLEALVNLDESSFSSSVKKAILAQLKIQKIP